MKRTSSGSKAAPSAKPKKLPRGRYARVWLSPEYLAWCQHYHFKPRGVAACALHTKALRSESTNIQVVSCNGPVRVADIYDLPGQGKEAA